MVDRIAEMLKITRLLKKLASNPLELRDILKLKSVKLCGLQFLVPVELKLISVGNFCCMLVKELRTCN